MILFYSGAESPAKPQNLPEKSLGGYISSTAISNGRIDGIFSAITRSDVLHGKTDTRLLVLTNTTGVAVTGVQIWVEKAVNGLSNVKLAAVAPAIDTACGNTPYFEKIGSTDSLPFQAVLAVAPDQAGSIAVGTIAAGASIGIWLSRSLDPADFPLLGNVTVYNDSYIQKLQAEQDGNGVLLDDCNLVVNWN